MAKLLWSGIVMVLLVSGCGWNGTPTRENDITPLTSLAIKTEYSTIAAKTTTRLTVMGNHAGYFTNDVTSQVTWTWEAVPGGIGKVEFNSAVPNRLKGVAAGDVVVTATVNGISASIPITVSPATISSVVVTPVAPSVAKGMSQQFAATGTFWDGATSITQDITFDSAWSSSDETVAKITTGVINNGLATTFAMGSATISAAFDTLSGSTDLTVTKPLLQTITVSPTSPTLLSLSNKTFTAMGTYSDNTSVDISSSVTWSSSNTTIATISSSGGKATTVIPGSTTIAAALDGITGVAPLTVTGGTLSSIAVTAASTLAKDTSARIKAVGTFSNNSNNTTRDITGMVTWTVADSTRATVTSAGGNLAWLNAVATTAGTKITASASGKDGTATLAVTPATLSSIAVTAPSGSTAIAGTSVPLVVTATFNDNSSQDVTALTGWASNDMTKATVDKSMLTTGTGRVTGLAAGTTTIQADYGVKTDTASVTVISPELLTVSLSGPDSVVAGNQVPYTVTANYGDGSKIDVTREASWSISSDTAVLADSVNQPGELIGVRGGDTVKLTVSFQSKPVTKTITVTVP